MHLVGNNPMLMRVSMPSQTSPPDPYGSSPSRPLSSVGASSPSSSGQPEAFRPYAQVVSGQEHATAGAFVAVQGGDGDAAAEGAWSIPPASSLISKEDQPLSPGHMNPQATAFAPAYQTGTFPDRKLADCRPTTKILHTFVVCHLVRSLGGVSTTASHAGLWICSGIRYVLPTSGLQPRKHVHHANEWQHEQYGNFYRTIPREQRSLII